MDLGATYASMLAAIRDRERVLVAFSGGVDSGLVAKLAHDALDGNALAVIADAESLSRRELSEARAEADEIGSSGAGSISARIRPKGNCRQSHRGRNNRSGETWDGSHAYSRRGVRPIAFSSP